MAAIRRFFRTTAVKLSLIYLLVFAGFTAFTILYLNFNTATLLSSQLNETIEAEVKGLAEAYERTGLSGLIRLVDRRARQPGANLYLVVDRAGAVRIGNIARISPGLLQSIGSTPQEIPYRLLGEGGEIARHTALVRGFELAGGFKILVGRDVGERARLEAVVRQTFLLAGVLLLMLGLLTWAFVSARVLKRIDSLAGAGQTIMEGDLSRRLPVTGSGDEFDRLAVSLNTMLGRIEELMHGLRQVSDNIAHDLKTPLTRLRNRAEAALRDSTSQEHSAALQDIVAEADQLIKTFNALLLIARVEAKAAGEVMGKLDLAAVARDVAELYEPAAEEAGVLLKTELPKEALVYGNRELIAQALSNLLDNSLKYGQPVNAEEQGKIFLQVLQDRDKAVTVSVCDNGPGIDEQARKQVLKRFARLDESRSKPGFGLGLSLAAAVACLHGAKLSLEHTSAAKQPEEGRGLCVALRFTAFKPIKGHE